MRISKILRMRNGITLVEVLIVLALVTLILFLSMNFLVFGNRVFLRGSSQFNVQSSVRLAATGITESVRYSTELEILSTGIPIMDMPYSYIYLDGNRLIHSYVENKSRSNRLLAAGVSSISFSNASANGMLLGMNVVGKDRDQDYKITQQIGLPNFELFGFSIDGANGPAIKFYQDQTISAPGSASGLVLAPQTTPIDRLVGTVMSFGTNKEVTWAVSGPHRLNVKRATSISFDLTDLGTVTVTATTVDVPTESRSVTINVVKEDIEVRNDASLNGVDLTDKLSLTPSFDPNHLTYDISATGNRTITFSAPVGHTISDGTNFTANGSLGVERNFSRNGSIYITVSHPDLASRTYVFHY